jgi:hypothetical protein
MQQMLMPEVETIFKIIIFFCPDYSWRISKDSLRHLVFGAPDPFGKRIMAAPVASYSAMSAGHSVRCWLTLSFVSVVDWQLAAVT